MKNRYALLCLLLVPIIVIGMTPSQSVAQMVNVTMKCNTSTCLDTLRPSHIVQIQGESKFATTPAITWTSTSGIICTNLGGDYWQATFQAHVGDTLKYKFVTFFDLTHPTFHWSGYEGPINAGVSFSTGDNRVLIVGTHDTTLALQYFNGWENKLDQYWRPFQTKTDSIAVYFRVNVGGVTFDPVTQVVDVRGGAPMGADPTWVTIKTLSRETNSVNTGSFWSGVAYVAKSSVTAGGTQQFKFVIQPPDNWESTSNRSFTFTTTLRNVTGDTTLNWVYFNNQPPHGTPVTGTVNFRLRLDALEKAGLFNRGLGDKIGVTGAKGWPPGTFNFDTEPTMLKMTYVPSIQEWVLSEPFTLFPTSPIIYKYYISFDSSKVDTSNVHFIPGLRLTDGWEEPGVVGGANRSYTFAGSGNQTVPGDFGADQQFFNSLHPNGVITTAVRLGFNIDMAPAANATTNPTNALFRPGLDTVYIQFDGCFIPITQGKTMYGTDNRIMLTDPDGDGKYTGSIDLRPPTFYQVCYRVVYTSPGGEVINGGGVQIGRRYYQYVVPTKIIGGITWPSTYTLAMMTWRPGADLTVENPPDLGAVTDVPQGKENVPAVFALHQNYPNPFNPSTVITYEVPEKANVKIDVFNILGQKVASLVNQEQTVGIHSVQWNAESDRGVSVSTGVYFFKMQAGSFSQVKKMLFTK